METPHVQRTLKLTLSLSMLLSASGEAAELGRSQDGSLSATLTEVSLLVEGATPGGDVAYLGANHEEQWDSWGRLRTYSGIVTDEDSDGDVEFAPELGISGASVWLVVDLASGQVRIDVSAFRALRRGGPAAPTTLLPGDRLLAIDLNLLDAISVDFQ